METSKIKVFFEKRKTILTVLSVFTLLFVIVGITYAIFETFDVTGSNSITLGTISMSYSERNNGIYIESASATTNEIGSAQSTYFDFNVSLDASKAGVSQNYIISITPDAENTLDESQVHLYLTDQRNNVIQGFEEYPLANSFNEELTIRPGSYLLHSGSLIVETAEVPTVDYYRLRMWVDVGYDMIESKTYKILVNVDTTLGTTRNVTLNLDGGTVNGANTITYLLEEEATFRLPTPVKENYVFNGWVTDDSNSSVDGLVFTMGSEDATVTALWLPSSTITLDNQDATTVGTTSVTAIYGRGMPSIIIPERNSYNFGGYYTEPNGGGTQYYSSTGESVANWNIANNTTLYAKWTLNNYTVTYDCNGGTGEMEASTFAYGVTNTLSSNTCSKIVAGASGMVYAFTGWATSATGSVVYSDMDDISSSTNVTLYAQWATAFTYAGTYTVIDDTNGNWRVRFTSGSATAFTAYSDMKVDVFLVGGGGAGALSGSSFYKGGGGGGGGQTKTLYNQTLASTSITIGAGGVASGGNGEATTGFGTTAPGGLGGVNNGGAGGNGGSGGGAGGWNSKALVAGGNGGSNGSNGGSVSSAGGTGLDSASGTREFWSTSGTLYAGGGGGGSSNMDQSNTNHNGKGGAGGGGDGGTNTSTALRTGQPGIANTGGGGGGGWGEATARAGGAGGSGIVIIRNAR